MKKVLFFVAVMLLSISAASVAQANFGLKAGLNIANLSGDDMDADSRLAPFFGAFANIGLSESLSFQPELLYSMKGAKESDGDYEATTKLDYLDIPLILKYNLSESFNLQAGPNLGLLLSAEIEGDEGSMDIKDMVKGMDLGFNIGAGYNMGQLGIDVRYNLGLSNISDVEDGDAKNTGIQIGVSYAF